MILLVFLVGVVSISANEVHDSLLGNVCGGCLAPFDFTCRSISSRETVLVLWVALVDGCGVDVLVVIGGDSKSPFVLRELIPWASVG